jgi:pimeloyl-ACP methyl ester carboxylesterase
LSVTRHPASDPKTRKGVLVIDFGGPAIDGAATLKVAVVLLPSALLQQFDVVSFAPRGTSAPPLQCGPPGTSQAASAKLVSAAVGAPPLAAAGKPLPVSAVYRKLYQDCHAADPALLPTVSSLVQARDLDRIREALGATKLAYLGISYGTVLGLAYAQQFPQRVAAMVLDTPVDPTEPIAELAEQQAAAAEQALARAFNGHLTPAVGRQFDALARRLAAAPLPAPGSGDNTPVSLGDLQLATLTYLQTPKLIPQYPAALTSALAGDGTPLRTLAASEYEDVDGTPTIGPYWATICGDTAERPSAIVANATSRSLAARYPRLGAIAYAFAGGACTVWPAASAPVALPKARVPIAVVGGTDDPITPFAAARRLAAELPDAVLITRVGEGHTSLGNAVGDTCLDNAVSNFLIDPQAAIHSARCTDPKQN